MANYIKSVAIIGATGNLGTFIVPALQTLKQLTKITALTRDPSTISLPSGVIAQAISYTDPESLTSALCGHDALIMTLSGHVSNETEPMIVNAAIDAGVSWIMPNEWSPDSTNDGIQRDLAMIFERKVETRELIEKRGKGKSSYIGLVTGFWYEWSLAIEPAFGFNLAERKATFIDDGETKMSVSTWPQVGRAVAAILSLPINPDPSSSSSSSPTLSSLANKMVYVSSFTLSQRDMLRSAQRVTNTTDADWTITHEPSQARFERGLAELQQGNRVGFAIWLYTRIFFGDGCGDFEKTKGVSNKVLGLPKEDLDEATKTAIKRSEEVKWG